MNDLPKPELLFDFSRTTLQDLQIASLDRAARSLKAAKRSWDEAVREEAIAMVASYFLDKRQDMLDMARRTIDIKRTLEFPESFSKRA